MNIRQALTKIWDGDNANLNLHSSDLADRVAVMTGKRPSQGTVNQYRYDYYNSKDDMPVLSPEAVLAGKQNRNNEQRRKWRIEEAVKSLLEEQASLHEMMAAGMQLVVLKAA